MSDRIEVPSGEHGLVRVFTLDLPMEEAEPLLENDARALIDMTGATALDPDHIDLFDMNDLGGMALADYLADGHGIPEEELAPLRPQIDRVKGRVLVMRSSAFEGLGQNLRAAKPLRWIATFGEARSPVPLEILHAESAVEAEAAPSPPPPTAGARQKAGWIVAAAVALIALGLLIGLLR